MAESKMAWQIAKTVEKEKEKEIEIVSQMLEITNNIDTTNAD